MAPHNIADKLMNRQAEFPVGGRAIYVAGIGYMLAWGTTVPGDAATGYGKGCKFHHTDGAGGSDIIYVNTGSRTSATFRPVNIAGVSGTALTGYLDASGSTVPADAATGYELGCIFRHTDGSGIVDVTYVNIGSTTSAKFRPVAIASLAGTAGGAGPSPLIWDGSLWAAVQMDPTLGFGYFNDYLGEIDVTTADGYVITAVTTGGISPVVDEDGGVLLVDSQGNAGADDGVNVQLTNCMFKPLAGRTIRFEARLKLNDNSALISQFAIGLAGVDTTLIAAGVLDDVVDKALWFHHGATTADKMSVCAARTSAEDIDADKATTVDDTYIKLGFVINGVTSIEWYADGVLVHTSSVGANIPNAVMCLSYVAQTEGASKDAELSIDWVRILQEGART